MGVKLRERGKKGWYVLTDWKGQRKAKCFGEKKKEAQVFANKLAAKLKWAEESGERVSLRHPDQAIPTVGKYLMDWLEEYAKVNCKISTYEDYERAIRIELIPAFGNRPLDRLKREDVSRFIATKVDKGKARSTIRNHLAPLRAALFQAVDDGLITINPVTRASKFSRNKDENRQLVQPLTREEVSTLLASAKDLVSLIFPFLLCAVRSGLRLGELIGLQWGDVDFKGSFLEVRRAVVRRRVTTPKNHKIRRVDMSPQLRETLKELKECRELEAMANGKEKSEWVFLSPEGYRWDNRNLQRRFTRCLEASGIRRVRFHDLRHTFASLLIEQDAHPKYIQEQMGHSSISVTMDIYGHLFPNRNRGWVNKLDEGAFEARSATQAQPQTPGEERVLLSA